MREGRVFNLTVGVVGSKMLEQHSSDSSQQINAAIVQEVGCTFSRGLHNMVLVYHFDYLVINTQPAIKTNVEDISGVMSTSCTVSMVIDNWKGKENMVRP